MTTSPTSSEETVSVKRWNADSDGAMRNVSTGEIDILTGPYVRASAYDAVVAERDEAQADLRGLGMDYETLLKQSNAFEIERDRLRQRVERLERSSTNELHADLDEYRLTQLTVAGLLGFSKPPSHQSLCAGVAAFVVGRDRLQERVDELRAAVQGAINYCHECKGTDVVAHDCEDGIVRDNCQTCAPLRLALSGEK